jgi:hypothetical protein
MTENDTYGINVDGIETLPNAVYGVGQGSEHSVMQEVCYKPDPGYEMTQNDTYGINVDGIETLPNAVYGVGQGSERSVMQEVDSEPDDAYEYVV